MIEKIKDYWYLTVLLFKAQGIGIGTLPKNKKDKPQVYPFVILFACMIPIVMSLYNAGRNLYGQYADQPDFLMATFITPAAMCIFILDIPKIISSYFVDSDNETLMQMPITPTVVVAAKGTIVLFQSYYIVLMLTLPPLIGIGRAMNADTLYWIQVAISLLLIPIVPICYASVLAIVMIFAFRRLRNRDALTLFSYGASLLLAIAMMMMAMPTIMNIGNSQEDVFVGLVKQNMGAFVQMIRMFPNFRLLTRALSAAGISSVGMMLLFALTCLLSVVVFLLIAEPLYKRGIRVMNDGSGRKGVVTNKELANVLTQRSVFSNLVQMEWRKLFRSPTFMMNCVITACAMPFIYTGIFLFTIIHSETGVSGFITSLASDENSIYFGLIVIVLEMSLLTSVFCLVSSTAISREGKSFLYIKFLPVPYKLQVKAKLVPGVVISVVLMILPALVLMIPATVLGNSLLYWIGPLLFIIGTATFMNTRQMAMDLKAPRLDWIDESVAVKGNFMANFFSFLLLMIPAVILAVMAMLVFIEDYSAVNSLIITGSIMMVIGFISYLSMVSLGARQLARIED